MSKDDRELIERLRAKRDTGRRTLGGGTAWSDGKAGESWGGEPIFEYVNPDGPAAATRLEALQAQPVGEDVVEVVTKAILFADCGSTEGWEDNVALGKAAIEAMPQEGWAVAALRDVVDPLAKLGRDAKAQGRTLSGEAYRIAHDVSFIKSIAKDALAALTASPPVVEREAIATDRATSLIRDLVIELETWEPETLEYLRLTPQAKLLCEWIDRKEPTPVAQGDEVREALVDIAAERERQISAEGWTPEHDDEHHDGSLAKAAACYARGSRQYWPWDRMWWKPCGKRANLVRAGALIVAEIERLDRATLTKGARDAG